MDRNEKLQYEKGMEEYFDEHKVYDLIEKLFEELIVNKPEKPIDYLIERLKRKTIKRIFITGYSGTNSKIVSVSISTALGYKCASTNNLIENELQRGNEKVKSVSNVYKQNRILDDEIIIDIIRNQIIKFEEMNDSYIIEGFPRNRTQAIFLQSMGILPDNVIVLKTNKEKAEKAIFNKLQEKMNSEEYSGIHLSNDVVKAYAKTSANEAEMNIKSLEEVFRGFYYEFDIDEYKSEKEIIEVLTKLFTFKDKINAARKPPRIVLVAPPSFNKDKICDLVSNQLKIIPINIMDLLRKEIGSKNENSKNVLNSLDKNELVNDKYVLKLLEDRLYCSDCMINGWIITGFPKSNLQINYMEKMNSEIKPNLIAVIETDENKISEKAQKIKYDPVTGKNYSEGSSEYNKLVSNIVQRLSKRKQDGEEFLKKRIEEWKIVADILVKKGYKNLLRLNGNESESKLAELIVNAAGFNS